MVNRRSLLKVLAAGAGAALFPATRSEAALPKAKITRVKCWSHPSMNRSFNQSGMLVTVETDIGITGIGEGGSPDLIQDLAGSLIGKSPFDIERIWHHMYMDRFYPPGREKVQAQGALDMALWDIKGKARNFRCTTCCTDPCAHSGVLRDNLQARRRDVALGGEPVRRPRRPSREPAAAAAE